MDEPRRRIAGIISGLDIHYDLGEGHPLLGRRMPDLDIVTAGGPLRVFELLHDARPVLLNLGEPGSLEITAWADRVQLIEAALRRSVGASRHRRRRRSRRRAGPARRLRRLGRDRHGCRTARRADDLVRGAVTPVRWIGGVFSTVRVGGVDVARGSSIRCRPADDDARDRAPQRRKTG